MANYILSLIVPEGRFPSEVFGEVEPTSVELREVLKAIMELEEPQLSNAVNDLLNYGSHTLDANRELELERHW